MAKTTPLSKKIIVSNRSALLSKYGKDGTSAIEDAVKELAKADARRGFATKLVYLDRAGDWPKVTDAGDQHENKDAVDGVAKAFMPEYLVLLGSHDVIPFQELKNPLFDPSDPESDPDRFAPGDLPYACEASYNQKIATFRGPSRVVGRIPDLTGASTPSYLLRLLKTSISASSSTPPATAFAIGAKVWQKSTSLSMRNLLGAVPTVMTSPTKGPRFTVRQLGEKIHFVNLHGDTLDPRFFGEHPEESYFDAMDARKLKGVRSGTVAAFECCFGAELYDPSGIASMSVANAYLKSGAYGVIGSTTVAYGPSDSNDNADVLCQMFLEQVLRGASLGRAFLEARLAYIRSQSVVDPYDEKTLAQFILLGDPSIHAFALPPSKSKTGSLRKTMESNFASRAQRRVRLAKIGAQLAKTVAYTVPVEKPRPVAKRLRAELAKRERKFDCIRVFKVLNPGQRDMPAGKAVTDLPQAKNVFVSIRRTDVKNQKVRTPRLEGILAYEVEGHLAQRRLFSR